MNKIEEYLKNPFRIEVTLIVTALCALVATGVLFVDIIDSKLNALEGEINNLHAKVERAEDQIEDYQRINAKMLNFVVEEMKKQNQGDD